MNNLAQAGVVRSWLISIAHHRTIDYLRGMGRRTSLKEAQWEELGLDERTTVPDVWEETWRSMQSAQVRAALMHIPTEQRMVIELAYFQDWTHTEIVDGCQIVAWHSQGSYAPWPASSQMQP